MANIKFTGVHKSFGTNKIITDFNLSGKDDEFLVLVGPSGCGKSTLLRMIAGLEKIDEGEIFINDQKINDLHPSKRQTAMVFQSYALYPHMNVYENMSFGLKIEKRSKEEIQTKVMQAAKILKIEELLERRPKQLSGGQRQRVAIGRAITRNPKIFLFDEPLSNLDALLRESVRIEIKRIVKLFNLTAIYVTHDQHEALSLSDRIALMHEGKIIQIDNSEAIYNNPKNKFVANFLGSSNIISAKLIKKGNKKNEWVFQSKIGKLIVYSEQTSFKPEVNISWRSEKVIFNKTADNKIKGKIENIFFLGSHYEVFVKVNNEIVKINVSDKHLLEKEITFFLDKRDLKILED